MAKNTIQRGKEREREGKREREPLIFEGWIMSESEEGVKRLYKEREKEKELACQVVGKL